MKRSNATRFTIALNVKRLDYIRMIRLKHLIIFVIVLLSFSCESRSTSSDNFPNNLTIPNDLEITFEQTPCKGNCWVYNLKVSADGLLLYEGIENVEKLGIFQDKLSVEEIKQLIDEFKKAEYFDLDNNYVNENCPIVVTDSPSIITSIRINGKFKKITHYLGCLEEERNHVIYPQKLYNLEMKIKVITNSFRWTGTK